MSIALWVKVEALEKLTAEQQRRIEALERVQTASRKPLADQAAANRAAGEALYAEVRSIIGHHNGPERLTGKRVLALLQREQRPSLRQIQDLMKRARAESATSASTTNT